MPVDPEQRHFVPVVGCRPTQASVGFMVSPVREADGVLLYSVRSLHDSTYIVEDIDALPLVQAQQIAAACALAYGFGFSAAQRNLRQALGIHQ